MAKLQKIKRSNGSVVYSINIPLEIIEELGWEKGFVLSLGIAKVRGSSIVTVYKIEDELNYTEGKANG